MSDRTTAWLKSGEYLPDFLRDFHDQKDVFKTVQEVVDRRNEERSSYTDGLSWIAAHVYTIDIFLWMMARHGYTLQRSRKRVPFADLYNWLTDAKTRRDAQSARVLGLHPVDRSADVSTEGSSLHARDTLNTNLPHESKSPDHG